MWPEGGVFGGTLQPGDQDQEAVGQAGGGGASVVSVCLSITTCVYIPFPLPSRSRSSSRSRPQPPSHVSSRVEGPSGRGDHTSHTSSLAVPQDEDSNSSWVSSGSRKRSQRYHRGPFSSARQSRQVGLSLVPRPPLQSCKVRVTG